MDLSKQIQKAEEAVKRRNYPLAIGLYQQILDLQPDSAEARRGLRIALDKKFEGKKGGGPLAAIQGFLPLLSAGISKLTKGHASRARSLERYLALAPNSVGANFALGDSLYAAGHKNSAYVVYRHLGEKLGADGRSSDRVGQAGQAWRMAGAVAHELKMLDEAMQCFEAALELDPRDQDAIRARKNLAAEHQLDSGYATAKSSRELIKDKEQHEQLEKAQRIQKSAEEIADSLSDAEAALEQSPDDVALLTQVGRLRADKGDIGGALDVLEKAQRKEPDDAKLFELVTDLQLKELDAELAKAQKLGDSGKVERLGKKAASMRREVAEKKVAAHPTDLGLRYLLGAALLDEGKVDDAIAEFQKAVKDPRHKLDALVSLGRAFRSKGMLDIAQKQLEKALEDAPSQERQLDLLYELGCLCEERDEADDARDYFSRILEIDISYKDVSSKLATLK